MFEEMCIPPTASEAARELRGKFRASAVEQALVPLFAEDHTGLDFHAGPLPDYADGVGVEVTGLPGTDDLYLGCRKVTATLTLRSLEKESVDQFAALVSSLPHGERKAGGIHFRNIEIKERAEFTTGLHHGILKQQGKCILSCEIDLTCSQFTTTSGTAAMTRENWAAVSAPAVECALAGLLDAEPGSLETEQAGRAVRITGLETAENFSYRDFRLELVARAPAAGGFVAEFSALAGRFPQENVSAGEITFNGIWCTAAAEFSREYIHDREYLCARLPLNARARTDRSQNAGELPVYRSPNRNAAVFDPATLERALAEWIAARLGLALNTELLRGVFPPGKIAGRPVAALRLTGVDSGNLRSGCGVQALLQIRTPHRDELFRKILALDAMLPRYDEALGGNSVRAVLKREFKLEWKEESGRNMLNADLALELIL